jgi:hypothetical protein
VLVDHTWFRVNEHTVTELPPEVMQFGGALPRILWLLRHADPDLGPVYLAKFDIADGFYRLFLDPDDATKLAVLMPRYDNEPQLVAIPLSLMMGWVSSPPTFCAASETAADLANAALFRRTVPPHRLETLAAAHDCWESPLSQSPGPLTVTSPMTVEPPRSVGPLAPSSLPTAEPGALVPCPLPQPEDRAPLLRHKGPIAHVDVFIDDFIGVAQGSRRRCRNVRRCIMHAVDKVFARPNVGTPGRKEAVSVKKLCKGDGGWCQRKEILGWMLDTARGTIELTPRRCLRVLDIFDYLRHRTRVSVKKWQRILGELRFMAPAIPGSAGLFGALQLGLSHSDRHRVRITSHLRDHLVDFETLARSILQRPTRIAEVVPDYPSAIGAVDAAKAGMGGVVFAPGHPPTLWQAAFPPDIQARIVSTRNRAGDVTNSDLEQAGVLAQADVATRLFDLRERTLATVNDNTAAVSRNRKGAVTSDQAAAYLCRLSSMHRRHHRYYHEVSHIKGLVNAMADFLSRRFDLTEPELLTYFDTHFPQEMPWRSCRLPIAMHSALISALRRQKPATASWLRPEPTVPVSSTLGWLSSTPSATTHTSETSPPSTALTSSSCTPAATAVAPSPVALNPSGLNEWRKPYVPWARSSPDWASRIPGWTALPTSSA